jgi:hypothetical protein
MPVTEENLSYLPPVGRIHRADVQTDDGHSELILYGVEPRKGWSLTTRDHQAKGL